MIKKGIVYFKAVLFFVKSLLLIFLLLSSVGNILVAQGTANDTAKVSFWNKDQADVSDLYRLVFNRPLTKQPDTCKKNLQDTAHKRLGPFYTPMLYPGYQMVTGFFAGFISNVSFYTHRSEDAKISTILINDMYSQYKQLLNIVNSNVWLWNESVNLVGDWRYYQYPTHTFGLGSKTSLSNIDAVDYSMIRIYEVALGKIADNFLGGAGINYDYYWNITETKQSPSIVTDLDKYGLTKSSVSSGFTLNLQYDNRLNANNPAKGTFIYFQYRDNLTALGSTSNWQSLLLDAREYIRTSKKSGNVLALWSYTWLTLSGTPPYFDLPTTGKDAYNNTARGYVEGRFSGRNLIYAEAEYRFRILRNGLLGGVLFSNASTVSGWPGSSFERINPGNGFGLRIKLNKSSATNLCLDYGFGTGGSRGFAFNLNEVF
jgi:outer membrane protein assembly factor BamA